MPLHYCKPRNRKVKQHKSCGTLEFKRLQRLLQQHRLIQELTRIPACQMMIFHQKKLGQTPSQSAFRVGSVEMAERPQVMPTFENQGKASGHPLRRAQPSTSPHVLLEKNHCLRLQAWLEDHLDKSSTSSPRLWAELWQQQQSLQSTSSSLVLELLQTTWPQLFYTSQLSRILI